jgi:endonuclease III
MGNIKKKETLRRNQMDKKRSGRIIRALRKRYGDVTPALRYRTPYELTIAVVLSAQTTDRQVNEVTPALFSRYKGFAELSRASVVDIEMLVHATGFYRAKAKNIVMLSKKIMNEYSGKLPGTREELVTLPGVGRKSANVILSQGFGIPAFAVDTHVGRVGRRIGYTDETDPDKVELAMTSFIPQKEWTEAHLLFITHGRTICDARKPRCSECPIRVDCQSADKIF